MYNFLLTVMIVTANQQLKDREDRVAHTQRSLKVIKSNPRMSASGMFKKIKVIISLGISDRVVEHKITYVNIRL